MPVKKSHIVRRSYGETISLESACLKVYVSVSDTMQCDRTCSVLDGSTVHWLFMSLMYTRPCSMYKLCYVSPAALHMLDHKQVGVFMVRNSSKPGNYALSMRQNQPDPYVQHYLIQQTDRGKAVWLQLMKPLNVLSLPCFVFG